LTKATKDKLLTREEILGAPDLETERVPVPEWGGAVLVRGLDGVGRETIERAMREGPTDDLSLRALVVAQAVVDEDGKRLFSKADVAALGRKSGEALRRVFDVAQRLSGLGPEEAASAEGN